MAFDRSKKSIFISWWWTVDKLLLLALGFLIGFGVMMVATASPAVSERIGSGSFYFVKKQAAFLAMGLVIMFFISLMPSLWIRRFCILGFSLGILSLILLLFVGEELNGATRWLSIAGMSLQPSEFVKPLFIVVNAWVLSLDNVNKSLLSFKYSITIYILFISLLILQPDFGMTVVVSSVWAVQVFLAGLSLLWIVILAGLAVIGVFGAYTFLPHVTARIDTFFAKKDVGDAGYQVQKSLEAFYSGGITGRGPWEGIVKQKLPDAHTDFIFAVVGEEFGAIVCMLVACVFAFIALRGLRHAYNENDNFIAFAVSGLVLQFSLQAMVNMGVSLQLIPAKGMTLPFISYGGSSMIAICMMMGIVLALTRKRYGVASTNKTPVTLKSFVN